MTFGIQFYFVLQLCTKMNGSKFEFSKIFWRGAHRAPSPDPSPAMSRASPLVRASRPRLSTRNTSQWMKNLCPPNGIVWIRPCIRTLKNWSKFYYYYKARPKRVCPAGSYQHCDPIEIFLSLYICSIECWWNNNKKEVRWAKANFKKNQILTVQYFSLYLLKREIYIFNCSEDIYFGACILIKCWYRA